MGKVENDVPISCCDARDAMSFLLSRLVDQRDTGGEGESGERFRRLTEPTDDVIATTTRHNNLGIPVYQQTFLLLPAAHHLPNNTKTNFIFTCKDR